MDLMECFSQQKDELIIGFANQHFSYYIKASLASDFSCLSFSDEFHRSKRNSVNLFTEAIGEKVTQLHLAKNERAFTLDLSKGFKILFKLHGNRSNILFCKNDKINGLFKNSLKKDWDINLSSIDRNLDQSMRAFINNGGNLKEMFPTFGKVPISYLNERHYQHIQVEEQWELVKKVLHEMETQKTKITRWDNKIVLSLLPLGEVQGEFENPLDAISHFYQTYISDHHLHKEKAIIQRTLEKEKLRTESYIQKAGDKLHQLQNNSRFEEIANIIMANLHAIDSSEEKVKLYDFYKDNEIVIKLKKGISPQKNAENYYRKGKNQQLEIANLDKNLRQRELRLTNLKEELDVLSTIESVRELRKVFKKEITSSKQTKPTEPLPYKKLEFKGYEILIGKNAKANDKLTLKIAKKDDLWLHAKDVSGSHVIIRQLPGKGFPVDVIEKAAALAAFYSKRKNDTLCPVIYTAKKHVRKPKSAPAGLVIIEKERVIMIEPEKGL